MSNLLTLLFVYLKLTNQIDWSWWWVTVPTWGPYVLALGIAGVVFFGACVGALFVRADKRVRR